MMRHKEFDNFTDPTQAILNAVTTGEVETTAILLQYGAKDNTVNENKESLLHIAVKNKHLGMTSLLLGNDAFVNAENSLGQTPLYYAIENRDWELVTNLVTAGADINYEDFKGRTPYYVAKNTSNNEKIIKYLETKKIDKFTKPYEYSDSDGLEEQAALTESQTHSRPAHYEPGIYAIAINLIDSEPSIRYFIQNLVGYDYSLPTYFGLYKTATHFLLSNLEAFSRGSNDFVSPLISSTIYGIKIHIGDLIDGQKYNIDNSYKLTEKCGYEIFYQI